MGDIYYEWITGKKEEKMSKEDREEAIKWLEAELRVWESECKSKHAVKNALKMAIKALEQEPCEDAISRQAVLDALNKTSGIRGDALKALYDLPPVTPQPKTGYWHLLDECSNSGYYCSECHKKVVKEGWSETVKKIKFCPNCGCRMMEVEE